MAPKKKATGSSTAIPQDIDKAFSMLSTRARESGITDFLVKNDKYDEFAEKIRKEFRDQTGGEASDLEERFVVNREVIQQVVKDKLYYLIRWLTMEEDRRRVEHVHYVLCEFLEKGMEAIPDEWKKVGEFYDRRRFVQHRDNSGNERKIDITPSVVMIPRGLAKSYDFTCISAIQQVMIDPKSKWLIGQGTKDQAKPLINQIQKIIQNPYLSLIMPDLFCPNKTEYLTKGGKWTTNVVDLVTIGDADDRQFDTRREYTFTGTSLKTSSTGLHYDGGFYDDLDNEDTTKNMRVSDDVENYWRNQSALANTPGIFMQRLTDTYWHQCALTDRLKWKCTYFRMPIEWTYEGKRSFISCYFDASVIESLKEKWGRMYPAHGCIKPVVYDESILSIGFDKNKHLKNLTDEELARMMKSHVIVSIGDPAYSERFKQAGDKKSRATILHMLRDEAKAYIFDVWQTKGLEVEKWKEKAVSEVLEKGSDVWIQDTQGTQMSHFGITAKAIRDATDRRCKTLMHDKKMTGGKLAVANEVLKDLFSSDEIFIIRTPKNANRIQIVIDQLSGIDQGLDILDCLVYGIDDLDMQIEYPAAMRRRLLSTQRKAPQRQGALIDRRLRMGG